MGFFPTDASDQDEVGPNANGTFFKYNLADDKWVIIPNADVYTEAEVDALIAEFTTNLDAHAYIEATALTLENNLAMGSHKITGLTNGSAASDAMAFGQKYTLEAHNNTYHSTNYHSEVDGTGVVTVHSDITSAGSGAIITTGERGDLHAIYSLEQHNNDYHSTNYEPANANIQSHVTVSHEPANANIQAHVGGTPPTSAHHVKTVKYTGAEAHAYVEANALTLTAALATRDIKPAASYAFLFDDVVADDAYSGIVMEINTTGCNPGDMVYIDAIQSVAIADASSTATMPVIGICVAVGRVLTHGTYRNLGDYVMSAGQTIYMSTTAGVPVANVPPSGVGDVVQVIGIATETDCIFINPSLDWIVRK